MKHIWETLVKRVYSTLACKRGAFLPLLTSYGTRSCSCTQSMSRGVQRFPLGDAPLQACQQPDVSLCLALSILERWLLVSNQVSAAWSSPEDYPCEVVFLSAIACVHLVYGLTSLAPHSSPPLVLSMPSLLQRKRLTCLTPWLEYKAVISSYCCMRGTGAAVS